MWILGHCFLGGVPVETSDSRCTHLVVEDSVTELPSGLVDQSHCQVVKQEVNLLTLSSRTTTAVSRNTTRIVRMFWTWGSFYNDVGVAAGLPPFSIVQESRWSIMRRMMILSSVDFICRPWLPNSKCWPHGGLTKLWTNQDSSILYTEICQSDTYMYSMSNSYKASFII